MLLTLDRYQVSDAVSHIPVSCASPRRHLTDFATCPAFTGRKYRIVHSPVDRIAESSSCHRHWLILRPRVTPRLLPGLSTKLGPGRALDWYLGRALLGRSFRGHLLLRPRRLD